MIYLALALVLAFLALAIPAAALGLFVGLAVRLCWRQAHPARRDSPPRKP